MFERRTKPRIVPEGLFLCIFSSLSTFFFGLIVFCQCDLTPLLQRVIFLHLYLLDLRIIGFR